MRAVKASDWWHASQWGDMAPVNHHWGNGNTQTQTKKKDTALVCDLLTSRVACGVACGRTTPCTRDTSPQFFFFFFFFSEVCQFVSGCDTVVAWWTWWQGIISESSHTSGFAVCEKVEVSADTDSFPYYLQLKCNLVCPAFIWYQRSRLKYFPPSHEKVIQYYVFLINSSGLMQCLGSMQLDFGQ